MIHLDEISFAYEHNGRPRPVLENLSLTVEDSEFVCLLGPSGCGKTTILNLAAGFLQPDSGRVLFDKEEVTQPGPERAVVFQQPTLFPWLTVRQNVEFGLKKRSVSSQEKRRRTQECLELVNLQGWSEAYPHALSGGMQQRVALARVLALEPRALLMDEPFGSLDANSRERLQDELLRIWETHRRTVLFVTHSVQEAAYLADRVVVLGLHPHNVVGRVVIPIDRPRDRSGRTLLNVQKRLRSVLDSQPCCEPTATENTDIAPEGPQ